MIDYGQMLLLILKLWIEVLVLFSMRCLQEGLWSVWFLCSRRCWTKESLKDNDVAQKGRWWQKLYNIAVWYWVQTGCRLTHMNPLGQLHLSTYYSYYFRCFLRVKTYCVYFVLSSLCMWEQWRVGDLCFQWQTLLTSLVGCGSFQLMGVTKSVRRVKSVKCQGMERGVGRSC